MRLNINRKLKRTTLITCFVTALLLGIGLSKFLPKFNFWFFVVVLFIHFIVAKKIPIFRVVSLIILGLGLGQTRGSNVSRKLEIYSKLQKQIVVISAEVVGDGAYDQHGELVAEVAHIQFLSPIHQNPPGSIQIGGFGLNNLNRGDIVVVKGKLYPGIGVYQANLKFATITVIGNHQSWPELLRRKFSASLQNSLPEPQASFAMGLLVGQRSTLTKAINDQLLAVGLTHLIAVSGYNVSIILQAVRQLFNRRSKFQTTAVMVGLLGLFLAITGLSASIIRAALVSLLSLAAWYWGHNFKPLLLILLPAAITAWVNPVYIWSDIGWYLSFLSFFGILIVAPLLIKRFKKANDSKIVGAILVESLAAQLMTLPYVWYVFHKSSIVALLSNLLIVPFVPMAMLMSFLAGIVSLILPVVSGLFALPARIILTYMLDTIGALSVLPHVIWQFQITLPEALALYGIFATVLLIIWNKSKPKYATITPVNSLSVFNESSASKSSQLSMVQGRNEERTKAYK